MFKIKTMDHYNEVKKRHTGVICLFFTSNCHQQDKSLTPILKEECSRKKITLFNIDTGNKNLFYLINKYGTGLLPKYSFIKEGNVLHTSYGLTSRELVKQEIKKLEIRYDFKRALGQNK